MYAVRKEDTWWSNKAFHPYRHLAQTFNLEDAQAVINQYGGELEERVMRWWFSQTEKRGRKGFFGEQLDPLYKNGLEFTSWCDTPGFEHPNEDAVLIFESKEYNPATMTDLKEIHWLDKLNL